MSRRNKDFTFLTELFIKHYGKIFEKIVDSVKKGLLAKDLLENEVFKVVSSKNFQSLFSSTDTNGWTHFGYPQDTAREITRRLLT